MCERLSELRDLAQDTAAALVSLDAREEALPAGAPPRSCSARSSMSLPPGMSTSHTCRMSATAIS